MFRACWSISFLLCLVGSLRAQAIFDADYRLPEGVYLSHAALLAAQPDLGWEAIGGEMVQLPETFRVQISGYEYKDDKLDDEIIPYAISLDGEPYLFRRKNTARKYYDFVGLNVVGTLSLVSYDTTVQRRQLMKAYNPVNGQPFREAYVEREETVNVTKFWHLPTGRLLPLTRNNLLPFIADDPDLSKALGDLPDPTEDLLIRAVKLFDDRTPTTLPYPSGQ